MRSVVYGVMSEEELRSWRPTAPATRAGLGQMLTTALGYVGINPPGPMTYSRHRCRRRRHRRHRRRHRPHPHPRPHPLHLPGLRLHP